MTSELMLGPAAHEHELHQLHAAPSANLTLRRRAPAPCLTNPFCLSPELRFAMCWSQARDAWLVHRPRHHHQHPRRRRHPAG